MQLPKGCACFVIIPAIVIFIFVLVFLFSAKGDYSWCGVELESGECEFYELERTCYCIDGDKPNNTDGLYQKAVENCAKLNGSLATPNLKDTLVWLSTKMFNLGFDKAFIGLFKSGDDWKWDKGGSLLNASNIPWHPEFPPNQEHTHAVVTVETVVKEIEGPKDSDYEYEYLNYNHYIENDRSYAWYGITSSDNLQVHSAKGYFYYICRYDSQPQTTSELSTTQASAQSNEEGQQFGIFLSDDCYCGNEEIILEELDDSQTFQSPRYPSNYCSDLSCRWTIKTKDEKLAVKLEWLVFDTETDMDFVFIYNGETSDSPMINRCSGNRCGDATSSANAMHVHFNSDHVTTDLGFKGKVTAIDTDPCYCSEKAEVIFSNMMDSFTISSPKYPVEYCATNRCKWTISVEENHGLQIVWNAFDIERRDHVYVYDGQSEEDILLLSCPTKVVGNKHKQKSMKDQEKCESAMTSSKHIHIVFATDGTPSSRIGFSGVVTPVLNYCEKGTHGTSYGSVAYSEEREDGNIPNGEIATLTCSLHGKIKSTFEGQHDTVTCNKWEWERHLTPCVPVCNLTVALPEDESHFSICTRPQETDAYLVESSHIVSVNRFYRDNNDKMESQLFTCSNSGWMPEEPVCNFNWMGIVVIGGKLSWNYLSSMELYNPLDNTTTQWATHLLGGRMWHGAAVLNDGTIMVAAGDREAESINYNSAHTEIVDMIYGSRPGPRLNRKHSEVSVAQFRDQIWLCGGDLRSRQCEVFNGESWTLSAPMVNTSTPRLNMALVALGTANKIL